MPRIKNILLKMNTFCPFEDLLLSNGHPFKWRNSFSISAKFDLNWLSDFHIKIVNHEDKYKDRAERTITILKNLNSLNFY